MSYRIKLMGFRTSVTPQSLAQLLKHDPLGCFVDRNHDHVGYIVKIRTMKHAARLMGKWHNKDIDGQKLKCQLEFNPTGSTQRSRSIRPASSIDGDGFSSGRARSGSRPRATRSVQSDLNKSDMCDIDNEPLSILDNRELDGNRRIIRKATEEILRSSSITNLSRARSAEKIASSSGSKCKFTLPEGANDSHPYGSPFQISCRPVY